MTKPINDINLVFILTLIKDKFNDANENITPIKIVAILGIPIHDQKPHPQLKVILKRIKAILKESVQSLPIFIDTPLGRLDDEHIKNILLYYYPDLSEQVVILSTNNEITPRRYKDIEESVSKS